MKKRQQIFAMLLVLLICFGFFTGSSCDDPPPDDSDYDEYESSGDPPTNQTYHSPLFDKKDPKPKEPESEVRPQEVEAEEPSLAGTKWKVIEMMGPDGDVWNEEIGIKVYGEFSYEFAEGGVLRMRTKKGSAEAQWEQNGNIATILYESGEKHVATVSGDTFVIDDSKGFRTTFVKK